MDFANDALGPQLDWAAITASSVVEGCERFSEVGTGPVPVAVQESLLALLYYLQRDNKLSSSRVEKVFFGLSSLLFCGDGTVRGVAAMCLEIIAPQIGDVGVMAVNSLQKMLLTPATQADAFRGLALYSDRETVGDALLAQLDARFADKHTPDRTVAAAALAAVHALGETDPATVRPYVHGAAKAFTRCSGAAAAAAFSLAYETIPAQDLASRIRLLVAASGVDPQQPLAAPPTGGQLGAAVATAAAELLVVYGQQCMNNGRLQIAAAERGQLGAAAMLLGVYLACDGRTSSSDLPVSAAMTGFFRTMPDVYPMQEYEALMKFSSKVLSAWLSRTTLSRLAALRLLADPSATLLHPRLQSLADPKQLIELTSLRNTKIATLALAAYLRTADTIPASFFKRLAPLLVTIPADDRAEIVAGLAALVRRRPAAARGLLPAFSFLLHDRSGARSKTRIFEAVTAVAAAALAAHDGELLESAVNIILELVDDCEYSYLAARAIDTLGDIVTTPEFPGTMGLRRRVALVMYNRLLLDDAVQRTAAAAALGQIGRGCPDMRTHCAALLAAAELENDDCVRDRVALALEEVNGLPCQTTVLDFSALADSDVNDLISQLLAADPSDTVTLTAAAAAVARPCVAMPDLLAATDAGADVRTAVIAGAYHGDINGMTTSAPASPAAAATPLPGDTSPAAAAAPAVPEVGGPVADVGSVHALAHSSVAEVLCERCGATTVGEAVLHSSPLMALTETDLELAVGVRRHFTVAEGVLVLEFVFQANDEAIGFRDLSVELGLPVVWRALAQSDVPEVYCGAASAFVVLEASAPVDTGRITCTVHYTPATGGPGGLLPRDQDYSVPDTMAVDAIELLVADFMRPARKQERADATDLACSETSRFLLPLQPLAAAAAIPGLVGLGAGPSEERGGALAFGMSGIDIFGRRANAEVSLMPHAKGCELTISVLADTDVIARGIIAAIC